MAQPSDKISPEKARQILKDDSAQGHKLTEKQRGMFGAAAGRGKAQKGKDMPKELTRQVKAAPDGLEPDTSVHEPGVEAEHQEEEDGATTETAEEGEEKYSLQVLRHMHKIAATLLRDFDEMRGPLEHEEIDDHLVGKLESLVEEIEELEALKDKHHPDGEAFEDEGVASEKDFEEDTEATSSKEHEEEEPTPKEAIEGMEKADEEKYGKSVNRYKTRVLRKHYKNVETARDSEEAKKEKEKEGKGLHCTGGKDCKCSKCMRGRKEFPEVERQDDTEEVQHPRMKGLEAHELHHMQEAHGFLKTLPGKEMLEHADRLQSFHHYKNLQTIAEGGHKAVEGVEDGHVPHEEVGHPSDPAMYEKGRKFAEIDKQTGAVKVTKKKDFEAMDRQDTAAEVTEPGEKDMGIHPHRHAAGQAAKYLKALSTESAFGDQHRQAAEYHIKALDPIVTQDRAAEVTQGDADELGIPGEMGEKALLKLNRETNKQITEVAEQLAALTARL